MFAHHLANSSVPYARCSRVSSQERRGFHVIHGVSYAHIDEAYGIEFSEHLRLAQQTLLRVCARRCASHRHRRSMHHPA